MKSRQGLKMHNAILCTVTQHSSDIYSSSTEQKLYVMGFMWYVIGF